MSKWFDNVINNYVLDNEMKECKIKIEGLSDRQQDTFVKNMKLDSNIKYFYTNERYYVELYTNKYSNRRSLIITDLIQLEIKSLNVSIRNLYEELETETNEEYRNYILEDIEEDKNKLNKLLELS